MDDSPLRHRSSHVGNGDMLRRDETPYLADEERPTANDREEEALGRILQSAANAMVQVSDYSEPTLNNHGAGNAVNGTTNGINTRRAANVIGHTGLARTNVDPRLIDPALFGAIHAQQLSQVAASRAVSVARSEPYGAIGRNGHTNGTTPPARTAATDQTSPMAIEEPMVLRSGRPAESIPGNQTSTNRDAQRNSPAYPSPGAGQGERTPLQIHEMSNLPGSWSHSSAVAQAHMIVIRLQGENLVKTVENLVDVLRDSMSILRMRADQARFVYAHSTRSDGSATELWPEYVRELQHQYGAIRDCQWAALRGTAHAMKQWLERYPEVVLPAVSERGNQVLERMARVSEQLEAFRFPNRDRIASERAEIQGSQVPR